VFSPDGGSVAFIPGNGSVMRLSLADQQRMVVASGARAVINWTEELKQILAAGVK
jgi:hypothetical protein